MEKACFACAGFALVVGAGEAFEIDLRSLAVLAVLILAIIGVGIFVATRSGAPPGNRRQGGEEDAQQPCSSGERQEEPRRPEQASPPEPPERPVKTTSDTAKNVMAVLKQIYDRPGTEGEEGGEDEFRTEAQSLASVYASRHFTGDSRVVVEMLKNFLVPRTRTLFGENRNLSSVARILVNCGDVAEIREWSVDLLGRTGSESDLPLILSLANDDPEPKVRQEATAALGKYLRFRNAGDSAKEMMIFTRDETDPKVLEARSLVLDLLGRKPAAQAEALAAVPVVEPCPGDELIVDPELAETGSGFAPRTVSFGRSEKAEIAALAGVDRGVRVAPSPSLDGRNHLEFEKLLANLHSSEGFTRFLLDFRDLKYLSSPPLGSMLKFSDSLEKKGGRLSIINANPKIMVVVEMMGLRAFFNFAGSEEEAVSHLSGA